MARLIRPAAALAITVLGIGGLSGGAAVAVDEYHSADKLAATIAKAVDQAAPESADVIEPVEGLSDAFAAEVQGPDGTGRVEIDPSSGGASITLDGGDVESELVLKLPDVGQDVLPDIADDGTAVFGAGAENVDVGLQALSDGAVRALTVINGAESPNEYEYTFELPEGSFFESSEDGGIRLYSDTGEASGAILPAWAVDAAGTPVPTRYIVDGSTVTQIVDHSSAAYEYPVVADPKIYYAWWQIFSWTNYHYPAKYPAGQLSIALSGWGRWDVITNMVQFQRSGWSLLKSKYPSSILTTTMRQQWDCHVLGGIAEWGTFDLERKRPSNANWRNRIGMRPLSSTCNW